MPYGTEYLGAEKQLWQTYSKRTGWQMSDLFEPNITPISPVRRLPPAAEVRLPACRPEIFLEKYLIRDVETVKSVFFRFIVGHRPTLVLV